jgi:predicted  nucleic acid-binding Zn-ribbon protein
MKTKICEKCGTEFVYGSGRGTYGCPKCHPNKRKGGEKVAVKTKKDDTEM